MQFNDRGIVGPDVSFYQGNPDDGYFVDFEKMKRAGVWFTVIKAGQDFWKDPAFDYNWSAAKAAGIPRAAYWFLDKDGGSADQARMFWNLLKDDPGEGPLIVDFEDGSGNSAHLKDFLYNLQLLSGYPSERIWIYTGFDYWKNFGSIDTWFLRFPLWLAWYTDDPADVRVPYPWLAPVLWQKGTTIVWGPDYGVHSLELDWNIFNGDESLFRRYFNTDYAPTPIPPEEGENMKYKVVWSYGVARRTAPHTGTAQNSTYTGLTYSDGQEVEVIQDNIPDQNDPANFNKIWVKFADGYYGASEYPTSAGVPTVRMEKVIVEPGPDPEPGPVHTINIYPDGKISVDGGEPF